MTPADLFSFRKRFKLTKKAAAFLFSCSYQTIANYENGLTLIPKVIALAASAYAMWLPPYGEKVK